MQTSLRSACAVLSAWAIVFSSVNCAGLAAQSAGAGDNAPFERTMAEGFDAVAIENAGGRTQVETWNGDRVRVLAARPGGGAGGALASRLQFGQAAPATLKISVRPDAQDGPVELNVYVPRHVGLSVRGGVADVIIKGVTGPLSVETDTGGISLHLPATASADLSLRAVAGAITSQLPLVFFGPVNTHVLDGRTGQGGAPVILRSARGSINLLPDDPTRLGPATAGELALASLRRERAARRAGLGDSPSVTNGGAQVAPADPFDTSDAGPGGLVGPHDATTTDTGVATADEVEKVEVRTVNLNARVTDAAGRLIPDLSKEDFQVFENNVEQEVVHFEPITAPVNLVLLLDLSGSTKDRMKVMKKAAKKFIDSLRPNTRIAAAAFTRKFMLISDFTDDRKLLKDRIEHVKNLQSGTAFYDAMWATLDLFKELKEKRKAIVVLTDGVDNSLSSDEYEPRHPFDELLARVTQEDATIYPIYFDTEYEVTVKRRGNDSHESYVTARRQLQQVADDTGGTLFKAERAEDLEGVYQRVASELHTLYSVAYNPRDKNYDGRWRNVSIKIKAERGAARTKRGFYAR